MMVVAAIMVGLLIGLGRAANVQGWGWQFFVDQEIMYYDPEGRAGGGWGGGGWAGGDWCMDWEDVAVWGNTPREKIWNGLMSTGLFTPEQAAAIFGNIIGESISPTMNERRRPLEGGGWRDAVFGEGGFGIAQWTNSPGGGFYTPGGGGRRDRFVDAFKAAGFGRFHNPTYNVGIDDLVRMITDEELNAIYAFQLHYVITELSERPPRGTVGPFGIDTFPSGANELEVIQQMNDPALITSFIMYSYLRPGVTNPGHVLHTLDQYLATLQRRLDATMSILAEFGGSSGMGNIGGGGSSVTCDEVNVTLPGGDVRPPLPSTGNGDVLIIAGHAFPGTCSRLGVGCRGEAGTSGYAEEVENRILAIELQHALNRLGIRADIAEQLITEAGGGEDPDPNRFNQARNRDFARRGRIGAMNSSFLASAERNRVSGGWNHYSWVVEIHFNAGGGGRAFGTQFETNCNGNGRSANEIAVGRQLVQAITGYTGHPIRGAQGENNRCGQNFPNLGNINFFGNRNIPITYLEVEFYDNPNAMRVYLENIHSIAAAMAQVIRDAIR